MRLGVLPGTPALAALRTKIEVSLPELDAQVVADIQLVATELVTNACLHGSPPVQFALSGPSNGSPLRIEVSDRGAALPQVRQPDPHEAHGRGLLLVDASTVRWGVTTMSSGKIVWAEF